MSDVDIAIYSVYTDKKQTGRCHADQKPASPPVMREKNVKEGDLATRAGVRRNLCERWRAIRTPVLTWLFWEDRHRARRSQCRFWKRRMSLETDVGGYGASLETFTISRPRARQVKLPRARPYDTRGEAL